MAYSMRKSSSIDVLMDYVVGVIAGLLAWPGLEELAVDWQAKKKEVRAARDARDDARELELQTTAVVRVKDTAFDRAVGGLSSDAFHAAGSNAKAAPYSLLFGTVKATAIQQLGPDRATDAGDRLVAKASAIGHEKLVNAVKSLEVATCELKKAEAADASAEVALLTHNARRMKVLEGIDTLIATTEARILTLHPGANDLVSAILNPTPKRRKGKPKAQTTGTDDAPETAQP